MHAPELTVKQILAWADEFHERTGKWPKRHSGRIPRALGETWTAIDLALKKRGRGLSEKSSLALLLHEHRGVRHPFLEPRFTPKQILQWADAHYRRTGSWPTCYSGTIQDAPEETWHNVDKALRKGYRGLPGGSSLARLLKAKRGHCSHLDLPRLSNEQILAWADAHFQRTGSWPTRTSGPVRGAPGEIWSRINTALIQGDRDLPGGSSLARLLAKHRQVRNLKALPKLRLKDIVSWADEHHARTGRWPTHLSGPIVAAPGETWGAVHAALSRGSRGLPGGSSLFQLLNRMRKIPKYRPVPST